MKYALAATLALTATAHAETALDEYGAGVPSRPAAQLVEASCDVAVVMRAAVVTVEVRQRLVNPGPGPLAARYAFDVPDGAIVTGFAARTGAGVAQALPIRGQLDDIDVDERDVLGADPALLVARPPGSSSTHAVFVQPIAPDHELTLTTRYTSIAAVRAGSLRVVLPGRAGHGKLAACRGTVRAVGGPGARVAAILLDGVAAKAPAATATFVIDTAPVVIDAELAFASRQPVVWTQTQALVDGWSATVVTVAAPAVRSTPLTARRALFVIDRSRSMELIGGPQLARVIRTIASALPANTTVDAIVYDRTARRVLDAWTPLSPTAVATIERAIGEGSAVNGSDLPGALRLARTMLDDGARDPAMVIVLTDGVLGDVDGAALTTALDARTSMVDVLAVILDPAGTSSPGATALRAPVNLYGGAMVEVNVTELDPALTVVDEWLRPSWLELALGGEVEIPAQVRSGAGFTRTVIHRGSATRFVLTGRGESKLKIAPRAAPGAGVAALVLADPKLAEVGFTSRLEPDADDLERALRIRTRALAAHPFAREDLSFAVLTTAGRIARSRYAMVKGGGPYQRVVAVDDPAPEPPGSVTIGRPAQPSAIARLTLERLFRDQLQPRAYVCYQRALGLAPKLAGTVHFELHLGRGEITTVSLLGLGDPRLDDCLVDAAYQLAIPLPDFTVNADDQTIARYPLTFAVADHRPTIMLGDADSTSPLDIDAIEGGVPGRPIKVNTATPLGNLRPGKR